MRVLPQCWPAVIVSSSQVSPVVTLAGGMTSTISLAFAIHSLMVPCHPSESRVSRAAPSGASFVPGELRAITGPVPDRCLVITSSKASKRRGVNRSISDGRPSVADSSFSLSSRNARRYSTGGLLSCCIRR